MGELVKAAYQAALDFWLRSAELRYADMVPGTSILLDRIEARWPHFCGGDE